MSEGGWFTNVTLEHADWIVDPGLLDYDDMIWISGDYEDGDDEFHYDIYLRPWGLYWKDMEEDAYPYRYTDWYLPLIDAASLCRMLSEKVFRRGMLRPTRRMRQLPAETAS